MLPPVNSYTASKDPIDQGKHNQWLVEQLNEAIIRIASLEKTAKKAVQRQSSIVSNISITGDTGIDFGDGTSKTGFIGNSTKVPGVNPVGGGFLYTDGGAGKYRGSSGTVTTFGNAHPHCPVCESDFVQEYDSEKYGHFVICFVCLKDHLEKANGKKLDWITHEESQLREVKEKKLSKPEQPADAEKVAGERGFGK